MLPSANREIWSQLFALLPIYLLQFTYGMNTGFPAILTPQLNDDCAPFSITSNQESWIVSMDNIAPPIVCLLFGMLQHKFGPRMILIFGCLPYFIGWLLTALSTSVDFLYNARFFVGIGHAVVSTTVYTVEVASKEFRGTFSVLESVLRCCGCLLTYTLGSQLNWKLISMGATLVPFSAMVIAIFVPESPVFLVQKGRIDAAREALLKLHGPGFDADDKISSIEESLFRKKLKVKQAQKLTSEKRDASPVQNLIGSVATNFAHFKRSEVFRPFLIIAFLSVIQQFSGMTILRAYVVKIFGKIFSLQDQQWPQGNASHFNQSGFDVNVTALDCSANPSSVLSEAYYSAIILGFLRLLASLMLSKLLLHHARRKMYFVSCCLTILSLVGVATFNFLLTNFEFESTVAVALKWMTLVSAGSLVFAVQLGVQTLPTLMSGELFPTEVRAFCKSLTRTFACVLLVICLKTFPVLEEQLQFFGTFYLFAVVLLVAMPIVYLLLPETKDVALEDVQHFFNREQSIFFIKLPPRTDKNDPAKPEYDFSVRL